LEEETLGARHGQIQAITGCHIAPSSSSGMTGVTMPIISKWSGFPFLQILDGASLSLVDGYERRCNETIIFDCHGNPKDI
jgi:hypothetical protein